MDSLAEKSAQPEEGAGAAGDDRRRVADRGPIPAGARALRAPPLRPLVLLSLRLRRWLLALADLVVPAPLALFAQVAGHMRTSLIGEMARRRIADLLEAGPLSAEELAARTGLDPDRLRRTLRGLVTLGIFARDPDGRFRNNRLSLPLRSAAPVSLRDTADYFGSRTHLEAWADFGGTLKTGANAFERVHGMSAWEWFEAHPEEGEVFAGTMAGMTRLLAPGVAARYPFGEIERLCDVGGGQGTLLAEVLLRHPHLEAVLLDAAGVLGAARRLFAARGIAPERVELVAGSFFDGVPAGCDAYLLKNVLHDWDDARALLILARCRAAMRPGHRLLVIETLVEQDTTREHGPLADLQMMTVCCEGRERGRTEYARLLAQSGFRLDRIHPMPGPDSVLEARAV